MTATGRADEVCEIHSEMCSGSCDHMVAMRAELKEAKKALERVEKRYESLCNAIETTSNNMMSQIVSLPNMEHNVVEVSRVAAVVRQFMSGCRRADPFAFSSDVFGDVVGRCMETDEENFDADLDFV